MRYSFKFWGQQTTWPEIEQVWVEADRGDSGMRSGSTITCTRPEPVASCRCSTPTHCSPGAQRSPIDCGSVSWSPPTRFVIPQCSPRWPSRSITCPLVGSNSGSGPVGSSPNTKRSASRSRSLTERFDRLDETFTILDGLMTQATFSHDGAHHRIVDAEFMPKPIQQPRIPFVVGGSGPKRTIPLAAKWADQWNYPDFGDPDALDTFVDRLELLHSACRRHRA